MAVRVPLRIAAARAAVETAAVLNTGFEMREPHLLLPAGCARKLLGRRALRGERKGLSVAGGTAEFRLLAERASVQIAAPDRKGPAVTVRLLVSRADPEVLVSDAAIDALGVRIESVAPGRWRFADEVRTRESESPAYW